LYREILNPIFEFSSIVAAGAPSHRQWLVAAWLYGGDLTKIMLTISN